jgi:glycosyltransferase involved in cell wall biosynthesis
MTRASVIIPTFNEDERLVAAVRSVLNQTYRNLELIVVDDASRTPAADVLSDLEDSRLRLIRQHRNKGVAAARNTGVAAASGSVLAFLDADDLWRPSKLDRQISTLANADAGTAANCCSYYLIRAGREWGIRTLQPVTNWPNHLAWGCDLSPGSTLLVRRDAFERVGPFDETLHRFEDWDWLIRFSDSYSLDIIKTPLAEIHVDAPPPEVTTRQAAARMWDKHHLRQPRHRTFDRRFRSAIMLERAAIEYRSQRRWRAIVPTLKALAIAPLRNARFYWRMFQNLLSIGRRWN